MTVSALIAAGQVEQIPFHLNRAMENGLTQPQALEVLTHLAFYAGWPNVFSAISGRQGCLREPPQLARGHGRDGGRWHRGYQGMAHSGRPARGARASVGERVLRACRRRRLAGELRNGDHRHASPGLRGACVPLGARRIAAHRRRCTAAPTCRRVSGLDPSSGGAPPETIARWRASPFFHLLQTGGSFLRRHLAAENASEYPIFPGATGRRHD